MPKSAGSPAYPTDARVLLLQPPDDYVGERTRLVKLARADGQRARATFLQSLKRPNLALWAVLAAGEDGEAVQALMAATTELAEVQAGGARATALSTATRYRRVALEALVDRAVAALARSVPSAAARRGEIRDIIDQLSRHPELADTWIDGTLRDLPEEEFGFGAFTIVPLTTEHDAGTPAPARRTPASRLPGPRAPGPATRASTDDVEDRAARIARTQRATQARKDVAAAVREIAAAERRIAVARTAFEAAATELRQAEQKLAGAEERHRDATARLEANT
ncbi:MAG: hypothetical protein ABI706_16275 [Ilumatobacteraceae bacterium]